MKKIITYSLFILGYSIVTSIISELLEINKPLISSSPFATGVIYSFIFIAMGLLLESLRNQILFLNRINSLVSKLSEVREEFKIPSLAIQEIMTKIVTEFKTTLNIKKIINGLTFNNFEDNTELPCKICKMNHITEAKGKCQKCKLPPSVWAGFSKEIKDKKSKPTDATLQ